MKPYIHPTAIVEEGAIIEDDVKIWHFCHVRKGALVQKGVSLARDVYVDNDVVIGEGSRIQNGVSLYKGLQISRFCFIGPHAIFTNDQFPRVGNKNWTIVPTYLSEGASIGAGAIIRCGITLGAFSMVAAGAIVTKSVPDFRLVVGFPADLVKSICACGQSQFDLKEPSTSFLGPCCEKNLDTAVLEVALKRLTAQQ